MKIIGIVGSLRKGSYNHGLVKAFKENLPDGVEMEVASISELPHFNADLESEFPAPAQSLKNLVDASDALIIATPEYNRAVPGVLKNAVDWLSRPYGKNSFEGKPVLVVGASPGGAGASLAQYQLKQSLLHLDAKVLGQPEFFVGGASEKFSAEGILTDEKTKEYIISAIKVLLAAA